MAMKFHEIGPWNDHFRQNQNFQNFMEFILKKIFQLQHGDNLLAMDSIRGCEIDLKEQGKLLR